MSHHIIILPCHDGIGLNRQDKWLEEILSARNGYPRAESRFRRRCATTAGRRGRSTTRHTQDAPKNEDDEHQAQTRFSHTISFCMGLPQMCKTLFKNWRQEILAFSSFCRYAFPMAL